MFSFFQRISISFVDDREKLIVKSNSVQSILNLTALKLSVWFDFRCSHWDRQLVEHWLATSMRNKGEGVWEEIPCIDSISLGGPNYFVYLVKSIIAIFLKKKFPSLCILVYHTYILYVKYFNFVSQFAYGVSLSDFELALCLKIIRGKINRLEIEHIHVHVYSWPQGGFCSFRNVSVKVTVIWYIC